MPTKIDLITGFLGAGKTTFILKYCEYLKRAGESFVIIENEFGSAGVDVSILTNQNIDVTELSGGCICCSLKVDFVYTLINLAKKYDRIIVEPSGIFTLEDFYEVALSPEVLECCEIGTVVTIVDEDNLIDMNDDDKNVFISQMHSTGAIIASKTNADKSLDFINNVTSLMSNLLGSEWSLAKDKGHFFVDDWNTFTDNTFKLIQSCTPTAFSSTITNINHALIFQSSTFYPDKSFSVEYLNTVIPLLFDSEYGTVLRVKGYLLSDNGSTILVNCTKSTINLTVANGNTQTQYQSMLNIIGRNLNRKLIKSVF